MNKEFIPYEEAVTLKELGYKEPCFGWYCMNKKQLYPISPLDKNFVDTALAPLYQQAFRWFREEHNIVASVDIDDQEKYFIYAGMGYEGQYNVYEKAELACLKKLIEIVKNKENENNNQ